MADDMAQNEHDWLHSNKPMAISSTYCTEARYDNEAELLYITHHNGTRWKYGPITMNMADDFIHAPSKGAWIWRHVRVLGTVHEHQLPIAEPS